MLSEGHTLGVPTLAVLCVIYGAVPSARMTCTLDWKARREGEGPKAVVGGQPFEAEVHPNNI